MLQLKQFFVLTGFIVHSNIKVPASAQQSTTVNSQFTAITDISLILVGLSRPAKTGMANQIQRHLKDSLSIPYYIHFLPSFSI